MITITLLTLMSCTLGTFMGNFALVYLLGITAAQAEKKRVLAARKLQAEISSAIEKQIQKQRDYLRMES